MTVTTTRFASLAPWPARLLLAALALLMVLGVAAGRMPSVAPKLVDASKSDTALYRAIARDTAAGGGTLHAYYHAAAAEQRARGYPLRPFVTMREPALALATAALGGNAIDRIYRLLALFATAALVWRLTATAGRAERLAAAACATLSVLVLAQPTIAVWHEAWAAMLVVPVLVFAGGRQWWAACLAGLAAVLIRELAAPVLVAMLFAALARGRRHEAIGWAATLLAFAVALTIHAHMVAAIVTPQDAGSPGWARLGGWRFILSMTANSSAFTLLPPWANAIAVPLTLFAWASRGDDFTDRVALTLAALVVPFMCIGRPDNFYWGLMIAPLLPVGLAFAPRMLADLIRSARQAPRAAPWNGAWTADASS